MRVLKMLRVGELGRYMREFILSLRWSVSRFKIKFHLLFYMNHHLDVRKMWREK